MSKYRIIEFVDDNGAKLYRVQRRWLIFWYYHDSGLGTGAPYE